MTWPVLRSIPAPVEVLGHSPELDDEVAGEVLRLDLAAFLPPEPKQRIFIVTHDDPGVRTANERPAVSAASSNLLLHHIFSVI